MIGYHWLVKLNGKVEPGRPMDKQGAGVRGLNHESVHIAYVGGLDHARKAKDTRTPEQQVAMVNLLQQMKNEFPNAAVVGHRDLSPDLDGDGVVESHEWVKQCPCFNAKEEYEFITNR
jgi:N-acetyl-anhydromuramyl-L-alanine amidase AmpD